jgi:hypothetical protein
MECRSCAVSLMQDYAAHRVCRLGWFTTCPTIEANILQCVAQQVNSAPDKIDLVAESVTRETKHTWSSTAHAPADGAEG